VPTINHSDAFYTTLWNTLDYTAASFPVTYVLSEDTEKRTSFYNHEDEALWKIFQSDAFVGAPVGLQVAGRSQEEEAVLAMVELVDNALKVLGM
jgi:amidase